MKKYLSLLMLLSVFLIGCTNKQSPSSLSSRDSEGNTDEIEYGKEYTSSSWDGQLLKAIGEITELDKADVVPSVNATSYVYGLTVDAQTNIKLAVIRCYGINEETIQEEYEYSLQHAGFVLSSEMPYGYIEEFTITDELVVQYDLNTSDIPYFELLVYRNAARIDYWPGEAIFNTIGEVIPEVKAISYEVFADLTIDYKPRISLYAYHVEFSTVEEYEHLLEEAGFTFNDNAVYKEAISSTGTLHMMYYMDGDSFVMYVHNDWPYAYIYEIIGMDLPRLNEAGVQFEYGFVTIQENYQILVLYFDYTTLDHYYQYGKLLEEAGFTIDGEEISQDQNYYYSDYIIGESGNEEHYINLIYSVKDASIAVAVYF